ncbi:hypothetical protein GCM10009554_62020 [Kribbella koreensis]|uniref:JmjC domain-containing protein n=1 Tax=Kribbella koreensis TaxID=57909 RepID=A0ABN1RCY5_9ACTN
MTMDSVDVTVSEKLAGAWRQHPVLLRGAAQHLLGSQRSYEWFDELLARTAGVPGVDVHRRDGEVTFIEQASLGDGELAARAAAVARIAGVPSAWCDVIRTYVKSGIGSHFDHSDNLVIQQQGVKSWRLSPPDSLSKDTVVARYRGDEGVGGAEIDPSTVIEYDLEPGDVMYIPLMWIHEGVGQTDDSLSISIVCPVVTAYTAVMAGVAAALRQIDALHRPLEPMASWMEDGARERAEQRLALVTGKVLEKLTESSSQEYMAQVQRRRYLS